MFYKQKHPEIFQGNLNSSRYFEGWYFKYVTKSEHMSIACIPGISLNKEDSHAFIQVFISKPNDPHPLKTYYFKYPKESFTFDEKKMIVHVGQSVFKKEDIELNVSNSEVSLIGHIKHLKLTPIGSNIMGPFAYIPLMETYHGIVSMTHHLEGSIMMNREAISFKDGKGYIEKDWGQSFPSAYTWVQANHFNDVQTSLFASVAKIPFLGLNFKGFISTLYYNQTIYKFATYNFSRLTLLKHSDNQVIIHLKKGSLKLEIEGKSERSTDLPAPRLGKMNELIKEGLSGIVSIKLYKGKTLLYQDQSTSSGIEIMLTDYQKRK